MMTPSQIVLYAARRCTRSLAQHQHTLEAQASIRQGAKMEKTWTYRELELREEIAKAIETASYIVPKDGNQLKDAIMQAAWIARYYK
jgi:hypothetical protein